MTNEGNQHMKAAAISEGNHVHSDIEYDAYLERLQGGFLQRVAAGSALFTTDADDLFGTYLGALPEEVRQWHNCHACRHFMKDFGGLVTIAADGSTASALWNSEIAPVEVVAGIRAIEAHVSNSRITGVFRSKLAVWGKPITGSWRHLSVTPPASMVWGNAVFTPFQAMAEKRQDFSNVCRALAEFPLSAIKQAITLLKTDSLYRSEKCLGVAEWLKALHEARDSTKHKVLRENRTWLAVGTAPAGFCHPRSSMIGTLLEDIVAGLPFQTVAEKFAVKMRPLRYQRPQAEPSAGNIAQAEKIIAQLDAAGALARRFARIDEVNALWVPPPAAEPKHSSSPGGVFAHLKPRDTAPTPAMNIPAVSITWEKFARTVMPAADAIEYFVQRRRANFCALVTAVNADAPPILQWDVPENRNPVSWYVYHGGSSPEQWGLDIGAYRRVTAIALQPSMWHDAFDHQGAGVIFILDRACDSMGEHSGLGLFPEILKTEFHGIRATIEAFSRRGVISGSAEASACGIKLQKGSSWNERFRVTSKGSSIEYALDRWD